MAYQRGSLKIVRRKNGDTWMLRFRVNSPDGRRVENTLPVGLVKDLSSEGDAWAEVDRLGLLLRVNCNSATTGSIRFNMLAEFFLKVDYGDEAGRPKSKNSIPIVEHYVRDYLIARWGAEPAEKIRTIEIQKWLKSLHEVNGLAWTTVAKIRSLMNRVYVVGIAHERVSKNPVRMVEIRTTSKYKAIVLTPSQTLATIGNLTNFLHRVLVLTCAATALRASEILALRWEDILWDQGRIRISKRWAKGEDGDTKTEGSEADVPMHEILAAALNIWREKAPYHRPHDFVFPSLRAAGRVPLSESAFVADHLRPAAKAAGVLIPDGHRFGLHNFRHSLCDWLINKAKEQPKTVQGILRHEKIQTTLDKYTQSNMDEMISAQGAFLQAMGEVLNAIR